MHGARGGAKLVSDKRNTKIRKLAVDGEAGPEQKRASMVAKHFKLKATVIIR